MIVYIVILIAGIVGFFIHLLFSKRFRTPVRIAELFLLYQLVFTVGFGSLLGFIGLNFMTQFVADYTGWPSCPFAILLGNVNLAYAVLGILCIWMREGFWIATVIGQSIWLFADGLVHLYDVMHHHNYSPGNTGFVMYTDFLIPVVLLFSLGIYLSLKRQARLKQSKNQ